jgi:YggT family protein
MIASAFTRAALSVVLNLVQMYKWIIVIRALVSWVSPDPRNPIVRALVVLTEPALRPFRRLVNPARTGGIDFAPVFAFVILQFVEIFLRELYFSMWRPL